VAFVSQVHDLVAEVPLEKISFAEVESNIVRWPDRADAERVIALIEKTRAEGDSLGGVVTCIVRNAPVGLGEPVFDKLEADLAKAMMSLPASKGFEIGSGFAGTRLKGSEHNDAFVKEGERVRTATNRSGGVQGGIQRRGHCFSRGVQAGGDDRAEAADGFGDGRGGGAEGARASRSVRVAARVPMVEAMTRLVLVDHWLRQRAISA
jgi:chorismate synthase